MPSSGGEVSVLLCVSFLIATLHLAIPISTISVCPLFHRQREIDNFSCTGDISIFPSTTELVVGPGMDLQTYIEHEDAHLIGSDTALVYLLVILRSILNFMTGSGCKVTELSFSNATLHIMDLPALDYFDDGSFYVLDTPGVSFMLHFTLSRTNGSP